MFGCRHCRAVASIVLVALTPTPLLQGGKAAGRRKGGKPMTMYERALDSQRRKEERERARAVEREAEELEGCTFGPAVGQEYHD